MITLDRRLARRPAGKASSTKAEVIALILIILHRLEKDIVGWQGAQRLRDPLQRVLVGGDRHATLPSARPRGGTANPRHHSSQQHAGSNIRKHALPPCRSLSMIRVRLVIKTTTLSTRRHTLLPDLRPR